MQVQLSLSTELAEYLLHTSKVGITDVWQRIQFNEHDAAAVLLCRYISPKTLNAVVSQCLTYSEL